MLGFVPVVGYSKVGQNRGPFLKEIGETSLATPSEACHLVCAWATHTVGVRSGRHPIGRSASPGRIVE